MPTAIILAAGRGYRLGALTEREPKCFLRVGPLTLLEHQMEALARFGVAPVVIVTGYHSEVVSAQMNGQAQLVENPRHGATNSLYSLWLARDFVRDGFVLLNADVLFDAEVLRRVLESPYPQAFAVERRSRFDDEEMKVELDGDRIRSMSKTLEPARSHAENVGVLKFSADGARRLFAKIEDLLAAGGEQQFCPFAFNALAHELPLHAVAVEDLPWIEIDFLEDLRRAREEVWPAIEARKRQGEPADVSAAVAAANPTIVQCN
ncbi:MAG: NTP transferase domain-containing protein [Candidatus Acidiferrales bacterium]